MKITLFSQNMYPPWIEWVKNNTLLLIEELKKTIEIEIITHRSPSGEGSNEKSEIEGIPVFHYLEQSDNKWKQMWLFLRGGIRSFRHIRKSRTSIICFQYLEISFIIPMFLLAIFSRRSKFILTVYATDELEHWYKRLTVTLLRKKFKKIIIISEHLRLAFRDIWFADSDIVWIPISFDKKRYAHLADFDGQDRKAILFSAGPVREAGSFFMVDLAKSMPDYRFLFAMRKFNKRSEDELDILKKYIEVQWVTNIGIERNLDNMEDVLSRVWALILPLQNVHIKMLIPVALLEAMARWTLCFVSNLPNLQTLVKDGENAIVFEKDNILDLKQKIIHYIDDNHIRENAYKFGQAFPDYPELAQKYLLVFQSLSE